MDSLQDILANKNVEQPPEVKAIKKYVYDNFQEKVKVLVHERDIIITVPSAALAGTLRMQLGQLQAAAGTKKRLVLRIGN